MTVRALKRLSRAQAYEIYKANPERIVGNISAASRQFGVSRGCVRNWLREWQAADSPPAIASPATPDKPSPRPISTALLWKATVMTALTYGCAVGLECIVIYFSVNGMVILFPGQPRAVMAMTAIMDGSKLVAAGWLSSHWQRIGLLPRTTLT